MHECGVAVEGCMYTCHCHCMVLQLLLSPYYYYYINYYTSLCIRVIAYYYINYYTLSLLHKLLHMTPDAEVRGGSGRLRRAAGLHH
jgi:hypothetical protein